MLSVGISILSIVTGYSTLPLITTQKLGVIQGNLNYTYRKEFLKLTGKGIGFANGLFVPSKSSYVVLQLASQATKVHTSILKLYIPAFVHR